MTQLLILGINFNKWLYIMSFCLYKIIIYTLFKAWITFFISVREYFFKHLYRDYKILTYLYSTLYSTKKLILPLVLQVEKKNTFFQIYILLICTIPWRNLHKITKYESYNGICSDITCNTHAALTLRNFTMKQRKPRSLHRAKRIY